MSYPAVQNVPDFRVRTNLDGSSLPERRKAYALATQGGNAPVARASGAFNAGETIVTVFNGVTEEAMYCPDVNAFNFWKTTFVPTDSFGSPDGDLYEILFVRVPGASTIAGKCLANP